MSLPIKKDKQKFTYTDYLSWNDDKRWELIDGSPYNMTPAPTRKHQKITGDLFTQVNTYLVDKGCEVYIALFDVLLSIDTRDKDATNVVQPDIVVICDKNKLTDRGCSGAPDLVMEVLSPATAKKDRNEKLKLYERVGVKEYWIVDPTHETIEAFLLVNGVYGRAEIYSKDDELKMSIFDDFKIELKNIFKKD